MGIALNQTVSKENHDLYTSGMFVQGEGPYEFLLLFCFL